MKGVGTASLQGDVAFADVVEAMGARVARQADQISVRARGSLKAIDVDLNHIPDAAMTLATLALFAEGTTRIRNIYNWRIKETDRMTAMATELRKVGATVTTTEDSITITPPAELKPAQIATYGDHRMAMCFSLLAMSSAPPVIENPEVTAKTFPIIGKHSPQLPSDRQSQGQSSIAYRFQAGSKSATASRSSTNSASVAEIFVWENSFTSRP